MISGRSKAMVARDNGCRLGKIVAGVAVGLAILLNFCKGFSSAATFFVVIVLRLGVNFWFYFIRVSLGGLFSLLFLIGRFFLFFVFFFAVDILIE